MGLFPSSLKILLRFHQHYSFEGPVLTLGNQEIWATYTDLRSYFNNLSVRITEPKEIALHSSKMFKQNSDLSKISERFVHAKVFFEMMGIHEYFDIDKFDTDKPYYLHDLNEPMPPKLHNAFSLILDGGTVEHIFDIRQVMENIVHMIKPNGCIIHISSFNIDHGFYAISPCFFFDFYSVNGFSDFSCYILQVDASNIIKNYSKRNIFFEYTYGMPLEGLIDPEKTVLIFFAARRDEPPATFQVPTQGIFDPDNRHLHQNAKLKSKPCTFESLIPLRIRPILQPLHLHVLVLKNRIDRYTAKHRIKKQLI